MNDPTPEADADNDGTRLVPPPKAAPDEKYKDKTFAEWQLQLEDSWQDSDTDAGWRLTLEIVAAYSIAIPHVECGLMDDKTGTRRKAVRGWLAGYACFVPAMCICQTNLNI